jgi:hypothetical protein
MRWYCLAPIILEPRGTCRFKNVAHHYVWRLTWFPVAWWGCLESKANDAHDKREMIYLCWSHEVCTYIYIGECKWPLMYVDRHPWKCWSNLQVHEVCQWSCTLGILCKSISNLITKLWFLLKNIIWSHVLLTSIPFRKQYPTECSCKIHY